MADRNGYIGRAPGDSSVVVARQTFEPTGVTTTFTFASGYTVGYLDVYINGVRLIEGRDYTATSGSTVDLDSAATSGDVLELVAYKAFNVATVDTAPGNLSVGGDLTVGGKTTTSNLNVTGITTLGSSNGIGTVTIGIGVTALYVDGSARVTGILTVGTASITIDGSTNKITVGSGVTIDGATGIISATSLSVGGQTVTSLGVGVATEGGTVGTGATVLDFRGAGISTVTVSSGVATINITGGGGGGGASVSISTVAPVSPNDGDLWYDNSDGNSYIWYDSQSVWVVSQTYGY